MMTPPTIKQGMESFRISTGLKDLIGRDLITDDFVAVFELVKNAFDAHATSVIITFELDRIVISDNGKGMSYQDVRDKWLFVAYSAKKDGTEDSNYRDLIEGRMRPFAGAKGVGRFSCDRLGSQLALSTRADGHPVQNLTIDWTKFEVDSTEEFSTIQIDVTETDEFPDPAVAPISNHGTVLEIGCIRSDWDREKLLALKRELSKLIDPFSKDDSSFRISIQAPSEAATDAANENFNRGRGDDDTHKPVLNGLVKNSIIETLASRTTSIEVNLVDGGEALETTLEDRGVVVYKIKEPSPYSLLKETQLRANVYFLNRSAKYVFARRMGLPSVQFGSVLLFRNGFRVFPVGDELDDFFGLNRRKQQGAKRYLGGRDVIGKVDIVGAKGFDEATSRNQGLIMNPGVAELIEFVRDKCIKRLERYVVDITWKDHFDKDVETSERMLLDNNSALISQLVSKLAATQGIELIAYNPDLVRIVDEKSSEFETSLRALELLGERTGDVELLERIAQARDRVLALEKAESEAREAERRAEQRAAVAERAAHTAEQKLSDEVDRNRFLVAAASLDQDTILNLHHQIMIHASDVHNEVKYLMGRLRKGSLLTADEWIDALERISYRNSQILTAAKFATKGGYKQQSAEIIDDLSTYILDYLENVSSLWSRQGIKITSSRDAHEFVRRYKPIDIGILIDNLVSNAEKAGAGAIHFELSTSRGMLTIEVADDGRGWPTNVSPIERVLEKGVTSTTGSGLGLYHVRQIIEGIGGEILVDPDAYSDALDGAHLTLRIPQ